MLCRNGAGPWPRRCAARRSDGSLGPGRRGWSKLGPRRGDARLVLSVAATVVPGPFLGCPLLGSFPSLLSRPRGGGWTSEVASHRLR